MSTLHLKNGKVFDPSNNIYNKNKDIYIKDGKIVKSLDKKAKQIIDCKDKIIMPGAIDLHTHIGGGKVNIASVNADHITPGVPNTGVGAASG